MSPEFKRDVIRDTLAYALGLVSGFIIALVIL